MDNQHEGDDDLSAAAEDQDESYHMPVDTVNLGSSVAYGTHACWWCVWLKCMTDVPMCPLVEPTLQYPALPL